MFHDKKSNCLKNYKILLQQLEYRPIFKREYLDSNRAEVA